MKTAKILFYSLLIFLAILLVPKAASAYWNYNGYTYVCPNGSCSSQRPVGGITVMVTKDGCGNTTKGSTTTKSNSNGYYFIDGYSQYSCGGSANFLYVPHNQVPSGYRGGGYWQTVGYSNCTLQSASAPMCCSKKDINMNNQDEWIRLDVRYVEPQLITNTPTPPLTKTPTPAPNLACFSKSAWDLNTNVIPNGGNVAPGQSFRYQIVAENRSTSSISGVYIIDQLPQYIEFVSDGDGGCRVIATTTAGQQVRCEIGSMVGGNSRKTIYFNVRAKTNLPANTNQVDSAQVYPLTTDSNTCTHTVKYQMTLTLTKTPTPRITKTPTPRITKTPTPRVTKTPTPRITKTPTPRITKTPTPRITKTPTPRVTKTPTPRITKTPTPRITKTPTPRITKTPTPRVTKTPTPRKTRTPTPKVTRTPTPTIVCPNITPPICKSGCQVKSSKIPLVCMTRPTCVPGCVVK